jgi:hypothetical protein
MTTKRGLLMNSKLQKMILITAALYMTSCLEQGASTSSSTAEKTSMTTSLAITPSFTIPTDPIDCSFNGDNMPDGNSVTAYQNSTVNFGNSCISETRVCTAGALSGSYQFANCSVGAPASCLFNGTTINHGDSVTGYSSSSVPFGQVCSGVAETRTCNNGVLSGSATFASCDTNAARSCLFDGKTILSGESITAFQSSTSQFGGSCDQESRLCTDGTLSGSYTFGSCTIGQPASCLFNGRTLAHGESAIAFESSTVNFGGVCNQQSRTCNNGDLSGSYNFDSCVAGQPASCSLNNQTITHGTSIIAFESGAVDFGQSCLSEARSCSNGVLSGTFVNQNCQVNEPLNCTLNGNTVAHGNSVVTYAAVTVPAGQQCQAETRVCSNGVLSGSAVIESCQVDVVVVVDPPPTCQLNGQSYPSDIIITAYATDSVPFGQTCVSESRQCLDGNFTGSFNYSSCSVSAPSDCQLNGKTVSHGGSVTVFLSASVANGQVCQSEIRSCINGNLSGSAVSETCVVQNPPPPVDPPPVDPGPGSCQPTNIIWEFPKDCRSSCGRTDGLDKSRISRDGGKKWLTIKNNSLPEDLDEIYKYMIKSHGKNSCGRPNVGYKESKNKGYVILDAQKIPDCKVCRFVEVIQENKKQGHHGSCQKKKPQKILKFLCGEVKHEKDHDDDRDRDDDDHHDDHHDDKDHRNHDDHHKGHKH